MGNRVKLTPFEIGEFFPVVFIAVVTLAVYGRILGHDFVTIWDDNFYVTNNPDAWGFSWSNVKGAFTSFYAGNYAPVQILSYMIDFTFWGLNPFGYLLTNILLHIINGFLFFKILERNFSERIVSLSATALFLLHPLQVETVAWVSQRKSLLAILFMLISWEYYCRWRDDVSNRGKFDYAISLVAFTLSLLSKSVTVIFPILLILHDISCLKGKSIRLKDKIPYLLVASLIAVVTYVAQAPGSGGRTDYHGGSPWITFLSMLPVFVRYLGMLVLPLNLSADYAAPVHESLDLMVTGSFLVILLTAVAGWRLWKTDRPSGFWFLLFWLGLLPVSQIIPLVTMMNDRYMYLPLLGASVLFGLMAGKCSRAFENRYYWLIQVTVALILVSFAAISFARTTVWRDSITLFQDVVVRYPNSERGWRYLADANQNAGKVSEARQIYERALTIKPDSQIALVGLVELLNNTGKLDEANQRVQKLLKINPKHAVGWTALGDNLQIKKDYVGAEKAYLRALEIQPDALQVFIKLGDLAVLQHRFDVGRSYFDGLEKKSPGVFTVAYRRACLEAQAGAQNEALLWLERAINRGYVDYDSIYDNPELENIWNTPQFTMLLEKYFPGKLPK